MSTASLSNFLLINNDLITGDFSQTLDNYSSTPLVSLSLSKGNYICFLNGNIKNTSGADITVRDAIYGLLTPIVSQYQSIVINTVLSSAVNYTNCSSFFITLNSTSNVVISGFYQVTDPGTTCLFSGSYTFLKLTNS